MRLRLKSCPRCGGDLRVDRNRDEWYEQCIQCGYLSFLESMATPASHLSREVEESPVSFLMLLTMASPEEVEAPAEALRGKGLGSN